MSIVDRAKNILVKPADEWVVITDEPATVSGLFTGYAIPLMLLPFLGTIIAMGALSIGTNNLAGIGMASIGLVGAAAIAVVGLVMGFVMLYAMILIVNAVSPSFNGRSDMVQSTKLMTYASTPVWVVGLITPFLGIIGGLLGFAAVAYVVYLIYLGLPKVLSVPPEKVAGFTVVTVLIYIVLSFFLTVFIGGMLLASFGGAMMAGAMAGA
ncbi:MAG: Yip1 family protein [Sphingorhabdus sp.]